HQPSKTSDLINDGEDGVNPFKISKEAITNSDATYTLQPVNLNRTTTFTVATVVTIPNSISSATAATRQQAWLSFKAASTINYPTTEGVSTLAVTAGALVYVERRELDNEWIVKDLTGGGSGSSLYGIDEVSVNKLITSADLNTIN